MKNVMTWLVLLEWTPDININFLLDTIESVAPNYIRSLDVGVLGDGKLKKKIYQTLDPKKLIGESLDSIEFYGGVRNEADPAADWDSYLLLRENPSRELMICSNHKEISLSSISHILKIAAEIGNLGYGFASTSMLGADTVYYMMGLTKGYPSSDNERQNSERLSRWFREKSRKISRDNPRKYLNGMQRGVFDLNILNRTHIKKLIECGLIKPETLNAILGAISDFGNETFQWKLSIEQIGEAEDKLSLCGAII
jgi:hypothetical protein